ncbi:hypothetical protein [Oscillibacter sp. MSJ-31]|uniref:hypothetical protein n=1 Tax=Oscillibacter sp. MSJ-31 TaxID=2841526 RepID=UPI001C11A753|nr:hypothetical protein [Oscillibacter sp. MSJ-31]MBU5456964.1 hypothetical protein [Oscillibacter sp. MSJ-31]
MTGERIATSVHPTPLRSFSLESAVAAAFAIMPADTAISDHPPCQTAFLYRLAHASKRIGTAFRLGAAAQRLRFVPYEKMEAEGYGYLLYLFEK